MRTGLVRGTTGIITALFAALVVVLTVVPPPAQAIPDGGECRAGRPTLKTRTRAGQACDLVTTAAASGTVTLQGPTVVRVDGPGQIQDGRTSQPGAPPAGNTSTTVPAVGTPAANGDSPTEAASDGGVESPPSTMVDGAVKSPPSTSVPDGGAKSVSTMMPDGGNEPPPPPVDAKPPPPTSTTVGPDLDDPATTTTLLSPPSSVHIGLIPPISVVRPPPQPREASGPASVAPEAPAPTVVKVLGLQVTRQRLPLTGLDSRTLALLAFVGLLAGSGLIAWGGCRSSDTL